MAVQSFIAGVDSRGRVTLPKAVLDKVGRRVRLDLDEKTGIVKLRKGETLFDLMGINKGKRLGPFVREKDDPAREF